MGDIAQRAIRGSVFSHIGLPAGPFDAAALQMAKQQGRVEPFTNLPTEIHGVPVGGQQRLQQTLSALEKGVMSAQRSIFDPRPITPQSFMQNPEFRNFALSGGTKLPPNVPDILIRPNFAARPSALTPEEFLKMISRRGAI